MKKRLDIELRPRVRKVIIFRLILPLLGKDDLHFKIDLEGHAIPRKKRLGTSISTPQARGRNIAASSAVVLVIIGKGEEWSQSNSKRKTYMHNAMLVFASANKKFKHMETWIVSFSEKQEANTLDDEANDPIVC
ncbi:hypothetical protein V6N11_071378 [Hibiscus sabdariffa]|uniref:Uncharacterized protein n=1 Tax=Hibiscus sabdariffa TaxID=183260 RepID=A0ABR2U0L7_9ROSI